MELRSSPVVSAVRCPDYDPGRVRAALREVLAPLGGLGAFVRLGSRVLVKPNFLKPARVDQAITTHPEVILAVVEAALAEGAARVVVGDSPGVHSGRTVAKKLGLLEPLARLGVDVVDLDDPVTVDNPRGRVYKKLELARAVVEADVVLNLCKLKTHALVAMTLATKNTFGAVAGLRKAAWHLEAGRDPVQFGRMLNDVARCVAPALSIADAVVALEGNGPGAGDPRLVGALAASPDMAALDQFLCEIVGFPPHELSTLRLEWEVNGGPVDLAPPFYVGPLPSDLRVPGFRFAVPVSGQAVPGPLRGFARRLLETRPEIRASACTACKLCVTHCPANAMSLPEGAKAPKIFRSACIHCFVCQEICPEGAIGVGKGLVRRMIG